MDRLHTRGCPDGRYAVCSSDKALRSGRMLTVRRPTGGLARQRTGSDQETLCSANRWLARMILHRVSGAAGGSRVRWLSAGLASAIVTLSAAPAVLGAGTNTHPAAPSPPVASIGLSADRFHTTDEQLQGLIEVLLAENPQIVGAWADARRWSEQVPQARSLPDPVFSYSYFAQSIETRVGPMEHALEFSQGVPWAGKRALQARRAEIIAWEATWDVEDLERQLGAALKRAYFEAVFVQEALAVNSEERELLRRFESIALRRYATGQGIQQSVVKVQTEISLLDDHETNLRKRLDVATRHIAELMGRPGAPLDLEPTTLPLPGLPYDRQELERLAISDHPRVRALEQRVEADKVWARRRALESRPDFRFGLGYTIVGDREDPAGIVQAPEDNGKDGLALTVGINIPIYRQRIRAGVAEAQESQQADEGLLRAARDRLRFNIQEGLLRVESSGERGRLYRDTIIPQAEESLASAESAYTTNRMDFLDLLDAERILFQSRLAYHRLVSDFWIALAEVEAAVGKRFPG
jgi:outer membrane protein, heavy metal efflux system